MHNWSNNQLHNNWNYDIYNSFTSRPKHWEIIQKSNGFLWLILSNYVYNFKVSLYLNYVVNLWIKLFKYFINLNLNIKHRWNEMGKSHWTVAIHLLHFKLAPVKFSVTYKIFYNISSWNFISCDIFCFSYEWCKILTHLDNCNYN